MKKLAIIIAALAMFTGTAMAGGYVKGYTRSDGTYVQGHYRSSPNSTSQDNYSTRGSMNPYTGQQGYKDPYAPSQSNPYRQQHRQQRRGW